MFKIRHSLRILSAFIGEVSVFSFHYGDFQFYFNGIFCLTNSICIDEIRFIQQIFTITSNKPSATQAIFRTDESLFGSL